MRKPAPEARVKVAGGKRSAPTGPSEPTSRVPEGRKRLRPPVHAPPSGARVFYAVGPVGVPLARLPTGYIHRPLRGPWSLALTR